MHCLDSYSANKEHSSEIDLGRNGALFCVLMKTPWDVLTSDMADFR